MNLNKKPLTIRIDLLSTLFPALEIAYGTDELRIFPDVIFCYSSELRSDHYYPSITTAVIYAGGYKNYYNE